MNIQKMSDFFKFSGKIENLHHVFIGIKLKSGLLNIIQ